MPTYEYTCKKCGERIEAVQSFHDKPLKTHTGCGGPLQRVFHASGVVFKGSGYYVTDSRSNGRSSSPKSGDESSNGSSSEKEGTAATSDSTKKEKKKEKKESSNTSTTSDSSD